MNGMRYSVSDTAEYGDLTRGPRVVGEASQQAMTKLLADIQSGEFAREWVAEDDQGRPEFERLRAAAADSQIEQRRPAAAEDDELAERTGNRRGERMNMTDDVRYAVACVPGDGVGPEVTAVARRCVDAVGGPARLRGRLAPVPAGRQALA